MMREAVEERRCHLGVAENAAAFKPVFRRFVLLCKKLDLFGRELLAVDGTRIKAVNNKDNNFTRNSLAKFIKAADEKLADYLQRLNEGDAAEKTTGGAWVKPRGENRGFAQEARHIRRDAEGPGAKRRRADFARRSR